MSIQEKLEQLKEIESLCQVIIGHEGTLSSQKDWLEGRADTARMIVEIMNRKGERF